jgi:hypothetical protein
LLFDKEGKDCKDQNIASYNLQQPESCFNRSGSEARLQFIIVMVGGKRREGILKADKDLHT